MKLKIICLNRECSEVPFIRLSSSKNCIKINTDCSCHHYKYKLEEYLQLLEKQDKDYSSICLEHNENYKGYSLDTGLNVCNKCINNSNENEKIIFFDKIKISKYNGNKFNDNSLSKLYSIIYKNFNDGREKNKLVAGLHVNYEYMNSYNVDEAITSEKINYNKKIFNFKEQVENYRRLPFKTNLKYMIRYISDNNTIEILNLEKNDYLK